MNGAGALGKGRKSRRMYLLERSVGRDLRYNLHPSLCVSPLVSVHHTSISAGRIEDISRRVWILVPPPVSGFGSYLFENDNRAVLST